LPFQIRLQGFDAVSLSWFKFKASLANTVLSDKSPLWNMSADSNKKVHDGLWLVEPHAGFNNVGAKWEEILVIEDGQARWLEEEPPHVKQVQKIKNGNCY
jgi:hypothetical protein